MPTTLIKKIVTHPGVSHADDVFAVAWMRNLGCELEVERRVPTPEELDDPEVMVLDIGGSYDYAKMNFDHHQRGGAGERWDTGVPYATFGLVTSHFSEHLSGEVYSRLSEKLIEPIDAADNGFACINPDSVKGVDVEYRFKPCSISAVISSFNPPARVGVTVTPADRDAAFNTAVASAQQILENYIAEAEAYFAAKDAVLAAEVIRPHVLYLPEFAQWNEHVFLREDQEEILYVVFPGAREDSGYQVQQVPTEVGSFSGRKPLPEEWAGLRGQDLANATGVTDAEFCHNGRFIGGAKSLKGTLRLAELAVQA